VSLFYCFRCLIQALQTPPESCADHDHLHYVGYYTYNCEGFDVDFCPTNWPNLELEPGRTNECGSRKRQSPIDLPNYASVEDSSAVKLDIDYSGFKLAKAKVFNNGPLLQF
jgi:carbonic anhydrase